jgi:hypothetical protein
MGSGHKPMGVRSRNVAILDLELWRSVSIDNAARFPDREPSLLSFIPQRAGWIGPEFMPARVLVLRSIPQD